LEKGQILGEVRVSRDLQSDNVQLEVYVFRHLQSYNVWSYQIISD
jgi:hypothetical protein